MKGTVQGVDVGSNAGKQDYGYLDDEDDPGVTPSREAMAGEWPGHARYRVVLSVRIVFTGLHQAEIKPFERDRARGAATGMQSTEMLQHFEIATG
jgi:hypothetical protein